MSSRTSVLMSVYYRENPSFFDMSVKSILIDQTKKPDEFVLVCDGPLSPELNQVIEKYEKLFPGVFFVYRLDSNLGLGNALNFGMEKCKYDIIIRADSDDICVPERILEQTEYLDEHLDVAVVSSYIDEFDEDYRKPNDVKTLPISHEELVRMAKFRNPINHMAVAFRKDVILSVGSYRQIQYVEDYELWLRVIVNGFKLGNIDKVLVHARVGNGMLNRRSDRRYIDSWRILCKYMNSQKMINKIEYVRNMLSVRFFIILPPMMKKKVYKRILRGKTT